MRKNHFFRFSLALTLLFAAGVAFMFVVHTYDNKQTGENTSLSDRIKSLGGK